MVKSCNHPSPKRSSKDTYTPLNYRGISFLSCVSRVFTGVINNRIVCNCEENVYEDEQNGFHKKRSCEDHIFTLTSILRNRIPEGKYTCKKLLTGRTGIYCFIKYNITGNIYYWIKAFYSQSIACVKVNNYVTNWFDIISGVHQGDSLSQILFGLFLNDLLREVKLQRKLYQY